MVAFCCPDGDKRLYIVVSCFSDTTPKYLALLLSVFLLLRIDVAYRILNKHVH